MCVGNCIPIDMLEQKAFLSSRERERQTVEQGGKLARKFGTVLPWSAEYE